LDRAQTVFATVNIVLTATVVVLSYKLKSFQKKEENEKISKFSKNSYFRVDSSPADDRRYIAAEDDVEEGIVVLEEQK
jgi:hypothetical protein